MSVSKKLAIGAAVVISAAAISASAFAAQNDDTAIIVGDSNLKPNEIVEVLQTTAGGNPMIVGLTLTQTTLKDRVEMAKQMAETMLFAEGAKLSGLEKREDVAFKLKWHRIQTLTEEYLKEISKKWDMSDKAAKKYYETHKDEFEQAAGTHIRHILTTTEKDAKDAIADIDKDKDFDKAAAKYSKDTNTAANGGDLGYVEKGTMPAELEKAVDKAKKDEVVGPIKTDLGWHIMKILDRRDKKQLTFEEAKDEVMQRMQMSYIGQELEKLKKKIKVDIKEDKLKDLAGVPAADPEKVKQAGEPAAK